jgi:hypothetical protein
LGESSNSIPLVVGVGKYFAWSRGIWIDYSPIKTRSSRKNYCGDPSIPDSTLSTNSGALRVVKALSHAK